MSNRASWTDRASSLLARIVLAFVVAELALARPALAQKSKTDGCLTDPTCRASYQKAIDQFDAGKYDEAFANFQSAYQRRQMPWLLVNIGRTAQRLGRPAEAIQYYERYKKAEPNIDAETEKRINRYIEQARALLEQTPEQQALPNKPAEPSTEVKPAEPAKPPGSDDALQHSLAAQPADKPASQPVYKKWWFWTIIGVAVAGGVAGAVAGATLSKSPPPEPFLPDDPIYMPTF
jgi:tetratricopeptide (TPR) repeat protein